MNKLTLGVLVSFIYEPIRKYLRLNLTSMSLPMRFHAILYPTHSNPCSFEPESWHRVEYSGPYEKEMAIQTEAALIRSELVRGLSRK